MKTILFTLTLIAGLKTFAATTVDVTSFTFAGTHTIAAELCGTVTGSVGPTVVKITVDEKSTKPGFYYTTVPADGPFCAMVMTFKGVASASVYSKGTKSVSVNAVATEPELQR